MLNLDDQKLVLMNKELSMYKVVLLRHGESTWNKENKFTGWTDVGLSEKGIEEGIQAGKLIKEVGLTFDIAYTSFLTRAIKTLYLALEELDLLWIPVVKSWRLNERHYGALQGLNKAETAQKFGDGAAGAPRVFLDRVAKCVDALHIVSVSVH